MDNRQRHGRTVDRSTWLLPLLTITVVLVYVPGLNAPFIYDDLAAVPDNPHIRSLWPIERALSAPEETTLSGRPLVSLTFAVDYTLHGLDVRGYHAGNIALHLLATLCVYGLVRRTLRAERFCGAFDASGGWLALAVATLWALHPLLSETVTYVVQRTELLAGLCYLLTLYCCVRAWATARSGLWQTAAVVACAAGMASKEMMVTAPVVVLAYDAVFVSGGVRVALRRHAQLYTGLTATWILLAVLMLPGERSTTVGFGHGVSAWDWLLTQAGVLVWYLRLCFWPHPLSITYDDWPIARGMGEVWAAGVLICALLAATLIGLRRRPVLGFAGLWFFVILSPTSSIVPIITEPAGERRMYLPLLAVVALIVVGGWRLIARGAATGRGRRILCGGAVALLAIALGWTTARRNTDYRSSAAIWEATLTAQPDSPAALMNHATAILASDPVTAEAEYRRAIQVKPDFAEAYYNLANGLRNQGRIAEAVEAYHRAIELQTDYVDAHYNLGIALVALARYHDAIASYQRAVELDSQRIDVRNNLGVALNRAGRRDDAIAAWRAALRIDADATTVRVNLADALLDAGEFAEAARDYRQALECEPERTAARFSLAIALASLGDRQGARGELRRVLADQPGHAGARRMLTDLDSAP